MSGQPTLLVTGASGHLGQRVVELLLEAGAGPLVAATRTPDKLEHFRQQGVIVREADFENPASLATAFAGVDRLLLISTDSLDGTDRRLRQHLAAVAAAEAAGVSHVIYTSMIKPEPETPIAVAPDHYGTEQALAASKLGWTFLRNNIYSDYQIGPLSQAIQIGKLFSAAADGKTAYVTREDCARAAAAALTSTFTGQRTLDITGPEALSFSDLAQLVSAIAGQQIDYVPLELETLIQNMVAAGLPRPMAEAFASFDAGIALGKLDVVSSAFEELTGRKPTRFTDFLTAQRETLLQMKVS